MYTPTTEKILEVFFVKLQESFTVQSFHDVLGMLIKIELLLETQFCKKNIIFIINFDLTLNMMSL